MDNAGVYSTTGHKIDLRLIEAIDPTVRITRNSDDICCDWEGVMVRITHDRSWDRDAQVAGIGGWISRFPDKERALPATRRLLETLPKVSSCYGCIITPGYDTQGKARGLILGLAERLDGFVFSHQSFYAANGKRIIGLPGDPESLGTKAPANHEARRAVIETREAVKASDEALTRKTRSVQRLRGEGVPVIECLPVTEDSTEALIRSKEEIAHRAIATCLVAVKGEGLEQEIVNSLVARFGAEEFLSPLESEFIGDPNPSQHDRIQFTWRYECLWVLLWALSYVDELGKPDVICDAGKAVEFLRDRDTPRFIADAKLRAFSEILDEADLIYRYHWAVTNARINGEEPPAGLEPGVVQERHYVLNWLIGYMNQDWDDISTDT